MVSTTDTKTVIRFANGEDRLLRRRRRIIRSVVVLVVATAALVVFILVMGDLRRYKAAMGMADMYVDQVSVRIGRRQELPFDLSLHADKVTDAFSAASKNLEWLTRDEAWHMRRSDGPVMAAWTRPVHRRFLEDGRAAVFFKDGALQSAWLPLAAFDDTQEKQAAELARLDLEVRKAEREVAEQPDTP